MPNTVENKILELPEKSEEVEELRESMKITAKHIADFEKLFNSSILISKKTQAYTDLVVFSELFLNQKINTRELYQELGNEGIISDYGDDLRYQRACSDLEYFCKNA